MDEIERRLHAWKTESHHRTSEGVLVYQRCECGGWRIELVAESAVSSPGIVAEAG